MGRYAAGDKVETWLDSLLCLSANTHIPRIISGCPHPSQCELYYVRRPTISHESLNFSLLAVHVC